jgi:hypothetical protein
MEMVWWIVKWGDGMWEMVRINMMKMWQLRDPTSPAPRNHVAMPRQPEQPLWFQLFYDILGNDQLTKKLCNELYIVLGNEEPLEARIRVNLPEKSTQRV